MFLNENSSSIGQILLLSIKEALHGLVAICFVQLIDKSATSFLPIVVIVLRANQLSNHAKCQTDGPKDGKLIVECKSEQQHIEHKVEVFR